MKTKQKALSPEALKKVVAEAFAANPEANELHVCPDGSAFTEEKEAAEWAKRCEGEEYRTVSRSTLKAEIKHAEENPYDADKKTSAPKTPKKGGKGTDSSENNTATGEEEEEKK